MDNPMDNMPPKQPDPDDRPANPATADFKNQPWYMELRNELRSEFLDGREKRINWWLSILAIAITLASIIGFDQFGKLADKLETRVTEVEVLVVQTRAYRDKAEKDAKVVAKLMTLTAENVANAPTMVRTLADNIKNNPEASELEKAIARALSLQLDNKTDFAIGEWENIAKRAAGSDNEQAANAWFSVGYLSQDPEAKILAYDEAIRLKPDDATAYYNRGNAKAALKQYKAVIADYDQAIRLKADYAEAYNNRGNAKAALKQYKAAIADYDQAIGLERDDAAAYKNRGNAKAALKQYKAAIADYDQAIRLKADYAEAYNNRGNAKAALKQYKAAIADYDQAIGLERDDAAAYNNRGLAKKALGLKDEARKDFETALELARNAKMKN